MQFVLVQVLSHVRLFATLLRLSLIYSPLAVYWSGAIFLLQHRECCFLPILCGIRSDITATLRTTIWVKTNIWEECSNFFLREKLHGLYDYSLFLVNSVFTHTHTHTHTYIYIYPSANSMMWAQDGFDTEEENYCLTIFLIHCLWKIWKLMFWIHGRSFMGCWAHMHKHAGTCLVQRGCLAASLAFIP